MNMKELKEKCLSSIEKETQLEKAQDKAENSSMANYHRGRKQVWLEVHEVLTRWF